MSHAPLPHCFDKNNRRVVPSAALLPCERAERAWSKAERSSLLHSIMRRTTTAGDQLENQRDDPVRDIERTLRVSAIALFLAASVWLLRDVLLLSFSAIVIACVLRGTSDAVRRGTRLGPYISLLCVILIIGLTLGAML